MAVHMKRKVGVMLLALSVVLSVALAGMMVWANIEAIYYGFPHITNNHLTTLHCPHFMAWDETTWISARVSNTTDHLATVGVKSWVSVPLAWELKTEYRKLKPGEQWVWMRRIGPENRELRHFIFASVYVFGGYPMPERQSMCGVYVLPLRGVRGEAAMWGAIVLILVVLFVGLVLWRRAGGEAHSGVVASRVMHFFAVMVPVTLAVALWMNWTLGIVVLVIDVLMVIIVGLSFVMYME